MLKYFSFFTFVGVTACFDRCIKQQLKTNSIWQLIWKVCVWFNQNATTQYSRWNSFDKRSISICNSHTYSHYFLPCYQTIWSKIILVILRMLCNGKITKEFYAEERSVRWWVNKSMLYWYTYIILYDVTTRNLWTFCSFHAWFFQDEVWKRTINLNLLLYHVSPPFLYRFSPSLCRSHSLLLSLSFSLLVKKSSFKSLVRQYHNRMDIIVDAPVHLYSRAKAHTHTQ